MDSLITAAARALAAGDLLGALKRVALRDDAPALALRGIAMAQLGDLVRAKALLRSAARAFGPKEAVARARCVVAEAEIALVSRDLGWPAKTLDDRADDARSARRPRKCRACAASRGPAPAPDRTPRRGRAHCSPNSTPRLSRPRRRAAHELVVAGIAMRRLRTKVARAALARAEHAARAADIPALTAEVESASLVLTTPAARLIARGEERLLLLEEVEALLASKALVVDACRYVVRDAGKEVSLATRPVLFALARALGEAWPGDVPRSTLVARAFRAKHADESHRARLRVEVARLRAELRTLADVNATQARLCAGAAPRARGRRAGAAGRRAACGGARLPRRRRVVVELGAGDCAWSEPAHRAAGARSACGGRQGAVVRSRASASLDDPARAGIPDNLVTPRSATE